MRRMSEVEDCQNNITIPISDADRIVHIARAKTAAVYKGVVIFRQCCSPQWSFHSAHPRLVLSYYCLLSLYPISF